MGLTLQINLTLSVGQFLTNQNNETLVKTLIAKELELQSVKKKLLFGTLAQHFVDLLYII